MSMRESRSASVEVKLVDFANGPGGFDELRCLSCDAPLHIHQPEPEHPERLLETCPGCGNWYLLDLMPDQEHAVMVLLPDGDHFQQILNSSRPGAPKVLT